MNLFLILVFVQILICLALGGLILIQRSEGGALGMGGGPSGFMSARGAGNLLTRLTAIFAVLFFANSIGLTIVGNLTGKPTSVADKVDASKLPAGTPLLPQGNASSSSSSVSVSAAPSLNDLPLAGTTAPAASSSAPAFKLPAPAGKVDLGSSASSPLVAPAKATPKPAQKAASSASSAVHSTSASTVSTAPSSSASPAPSSSASTTPSTPASSQ